MRSESRIPKLRDTTFDGVLLWFSEMQCSHLLFHPEDDPAEIIRTSNGERLFSNIEVAELRELLQEIEDGLGHEKLIEAAYPIFMHASGIQLDA